MADKRFLGLGFTFAASDKGLEKKLKKISDLTWSISDALGAISKGAQKASSSMSGMKGTGGGGGGRGGSGRGGIGRGSSKGFPTVHISRSSIQSLCACIRKAKGGFYEMPAAQRVVKEAAPPTTRKMTLLDIESAKEEALIGAQLQKLFQETPGFMNLTKEAMQTFLQDMEKTEFEFSGFDDTVSLTKKSMRIFSENAASFVKQTDSMNKEMKGLSKTLPGILDWLKGIRGAASEFLTSLGLDLQKIIPPQVKALLGLGKAVVGAPLKKLFGNIFGKKQDKLQKDQIKQSGFPRYGLKSEAHGFSKLLKAVEPEKKKGFFEKLFGGIGQAIGALLSLGATILEIVAAVAIFGSAIHGIIKGVMATKDMFISFGKAVWHIVTSVAGFIQRLFGLDKFFGGISRSMPTTIMGWLKLISEGWENIAGWLGLAAGFLAPIVDKIAKFLDDFHLFDGLIPKIGEMIIQGWENIFQWIGYGAKLIKEGWENIFGWISYGATLLKKGWDLISDFISKFLSSWIVKKVTGFLGFGSSPTPPQEMTPPTPDQYRRDQTQFSNAAMNQSQPVGMTSDKLEELNTTLQDIHQTMLGLRKDTQQVGQRPIQAQVVGDMNKFLKASDNAARKSFGGAGKTL